MGTPNANAARKPLDIAGFPGSDWIRNLRKLLRFRSIIFAQAQAQAVFSTLQLTPGEIIDIDINSANNLSPSPLVFNVADKAFATAATTPIIGGLQTIEASVSLDIGYSATPALTLEPFVIA